MERLEGRDYLLLVNHHVATNVLQQLPSYIDLEKTCGHLYFSCNCYLMSRIYADPLWLLPTIYGAFTPFVVVAHHLQRFYTLCGCCLPSITPINHLWMLPTICSYVTFHVGLKSFVYLFVVAFQWQLPSYGIKYFLFQKPQIMEMYRKNEK